MEVHAPDRCHHADISVILSAHGSGRCCDRLQSAPRGGPHVPSSNGALERGGNDCGICVLDGRLYYSVFFGYDAETNTIHLNSQHYSIVEDEDDPTAFWALVESHERKL